MHILMSKSKKVNESSDEYSELRDQLLNNCQSLVDVSNELNEMVVSVFKQTSDTSELTSIKDEWVKSSSKIDMLKDSIMEMTNNKNSIIKKIETIINKKCTIQKNHRCNN